MSRAVRHLHREGKLGERGDRPDAPLGHPRAARTRRRDHRRLGLVPLRHRLGRDLFGDDLRPEEGREPVDQREIIRKLVALQYKRNDAAFARGNFRVRGDSLEIFPAHYEDMAWRISFFGDEIEEIGEFDPLTGKKGASLDTVRVYANSHYVTPGPTMKQATEAIKLRAGRAAQGTGGRGQTARSPAAGTAHQFRSRDDRRHRQLRRDRELLAASSPAACRASRRRPCSNICPTTPCCSSTKATRPCRRSARCRKGDHRRKITLAEYGFRLPSCIDNRPLRFNEWDAMRPQTFAVSATPGKWEMEQTGGVFAEQVIRPTGLIDPPVEIKPVEDQVQDCINECRATAAQGLSHARHHADQAHGRGPDRVHARGGPARALHAFATSRRWSASS